MPPKRGSKKPRVEDEESLVSESESMASEVSVKSKGKKRRQGAKIDVSPKSKKAVKKTSPSTPQKADDKSPTKVVKSAKIDFTPQMESATARMYFDGENPESGCNLELKPHEVEHGGKKYMVFQGVMRRDHEVKLGDRVAPLSGAVTLALNNTY